MPAARIESLGTPGIWFALSFAGMPRIYDVPLKSALALILIVFPFVIYSWYRMIKAEGRCLYCVAYAIAGTAYLIGLAIFLEGRGEFARTFLALIFLGHASLGVWAIVRALRLCFQRDVRLIC
jgi:uncharacterized membrane protein